MVTLYCNLNLKYIYFSYEIYLNILLKLNFIKNNNQRKEI